MRVDIAKMTTWMRAPCHPATKKPEIIAGVLHGKVTPENGCIKPIAIEP